MGDAVTTLRFSGGKAWIDGEFLVVKRDGLNRAKKLKIKAITKLEADAPNYCLWIHLKGNEHTHLQGGHYFDPLEPFVNELRKVNASIDMVVTPVDETPSSPEPMIINNYINNGPGKVNMGRTMGKAVVFLPWAFMRPSRKKNKR